jgi:2-iminoacetate synthase
MNFEPCDVSDLILIKIICLTRIQFPRVGINLSTRENQKLRDHAIELGVTRISAASKTSVGGYTSPEPEKLDPQFDIQDNRPVEEIVLMLKKRGFDPVFTDWRRIENETLKRDALKNSQERELKQSYS